jgi:TP901 family phage tail tape measure protein
MSPGEDTAKDAAEAQKKAEELSAKGVISATELAEAYYNARMNGLKHTDALAAMNAGNNLTIATTRNAADAQAQLATTTRTLTTLNKLSGVGVNELGDQLAALQTRYAELDISEVTGGLTYAMPVSRAAGIAVPEMNAALAMLSMGGMHGEMAGTAYREMIAKLTTKDDLQPFLKRTKQGGLELADTIQTIASSMANLSPLQRTMALKKLGFDLRDVQGMNILIDKVGELKSLEADLTNSRGEAERLAKVRMSAADEQWANLMNNLDLLRATVGETLLPLVNRIIPRLADGLKSMRGWAEANRGWVKWAAEAMAWGAAILIPLGAIAMLC